MKKIGLLILSICMLFSIFHINNVDAVNFAGQENKYIKLCSSSKLTNSQQKTCKEFNSYLSEKNKDLKNELKEEKENLAETKSELQTVESQLSDLNSQIKQKQTEISYLEKTIKNTETTLKEKNEEMEERLYAMQTYYNSNVFMSFLFGSDGFSDFFSRIRSINDITAYEKELASELQEDIKELNKKKDTLDSAKENLLSQKNQIKVLENKLENIKQNQQNEIKDIQSEQSEISAAQKKIDENLTRLYEESLKENSSTGVGQITGSELGVKIANKALSKQGCRYWWGAPGGGYGDGQGLDNPNAKYFDCSGLVAWAHRQSGVKIGRTTASGYSRSGKAVSYSKLQVGDVITFSSGGSVTHIGIYIGKVNGTRSFVHASGKGSGTRGQYAAQCVKVNSIEPGSYYYNKIYNCRRLY